MRHRRKLLITIYVRSIQEDNPNTFLLLLKGYCAGVPGHKQCVQWNTMHSYPESNSDHKRMAGEEYRNGIMIHDMPPKYSRTQLHHMELRVFLSQIQFHWF